MHTHTYRDIAIYLKENEGKTFYTVTGRAFQYQMRDKGLYISRVKDTGKETFSYQNLDFALVQMLAKIPADAPSKLHSVMGASYCYVILKDYLDKADETLSS